MWLRLIKSPIKLKKRPLYCPLNLFFSVLHHQSSLTVRQAGIKDAILIRLKALSSRKFT
jgi:hypothetical protein